MDIALVRLKKKSDGNTELEYAGANNSILIMEPNKSVIKEIKANKQPIGQFENQEPFKTTKINLPRKSTFYLFSDGFPDQFGGPDGKKFKSSKFKKLIVDIQDLSISDQGKKMREIFIDWKDNYEQLDDVCVIGVRV